jgi:hypothetical protein
MKTHGWSDNWRVMALLSVLAALALPICEAAGIHDDPIARLVTPLAAISPVLSVVALILARILWRREREQRAAR